ncbi:hypothetical protein TWF106_008991 [Orbilia oligospora]|uniref:Uncharacterized protein n=1 Tax=Orbilia oligospora TaxID=2813651 RepID=A0A7C8QJ69_ORBOL|nr:hypothetical protein TWF106_008991 [Orbilia oligospora]
MDREIQNPASFTFPYIPPAATGPMLSPFAMMMPTGVRLHNSNPTPQNPQAFSHSHNTLTDKEWLNKVEVEFQKLDGLFGGLLRDVNESTVVISRLEQQGELFEWLVLTTSPLETISNPNPETVGSQKPPASERTTAAGGAGGNPGPLSKLQPKH